MKDAYRLGLDLGTNSIGWCVVDLDDKGKATGIRDCGVRIFSDGRNPKDGTSLATMRRVPRSMRRRRDRYLKRRTRLMDALVSLGLMPDDEAERKRLEALDPYEMRARALEGPLKPHELGRALFHLNQRRGFQSNRKADKLAESERSQLKEAINTLHKRIEDSGARTLGEHLYRRHRKGKPVRARAELDIYPDRVLYEQEFDAIRAAQEPHQRLSLADWESLADIIFFQRALRAVDPGKCTLEPSLPRAPWALPQAQQFRILQEVNNLRVELFGKPSRSLTLEEREALLAKLGGQKEVKFDSLGKLFGLPEETRFNLWDENRTALKGDQTAARLSSKKLFGKRWHELPEPRQTEIVRALLNQEDREVLLKRAVDEWGLETEAAERVVDASLPSGYARFGENAISKLVPIMRDQGLMLYDAIAESPDYAHHSDFRPKKRLDRLPYYGAVLHRHVVGGDHEAETEVERYGRIANPTVHIGLNQLRRVMNKLIEVYGHPDEVVIEIARELKQSYEDRQRMRREHRENQTANETRSAEIEKAGFVPSGELLRKLRLWEEQGPPGDRRCPFTGEPITFDMAISDQTEMEHLLPFSRTLDNSMANKVLCLRRANRDKGNRTPYEAFGDRSKGYDYDAILTRAEMLPGNKRWRFQPDAMERFDKQRGFLDRHLNETKYLSRIAAQYAAHVAPKVRVVPGTLTGLLRGKWGLNGLLSDSNKKVRTDHRHHTIDAFVVAMTTQGMLQAVANAAERSPEDRGKLIEEMPLPWEGFAPDDLRGPLERLVVSHKPDHGTPGSWQQTTGALHNDTAYGIEERLPDGRYAVVHRVPLDGIKKAADLERVKDNALRTRLLDLWERTVGAGEKPSAFVQAARNEFGVRSVRVVETVSGVAIANSEEQPYKVYKTDGNAFMDIYQTLDGRWRAETITRFRANQPNAEPSWKRDHPAAKKIARLHVDDLVALGKEAERRIYRVVKLSGSTATLAEHHEGGALKARDADKDDLFRYVSGSPSRLQKEGFRRLGVDELGRVSDPGPPR